MKEVSFFRYVLGTFRSVVKRRKAWLRANRIDYSAGKVSKELYNLGNFMINGACFLYYDFWVMIALFILGLIFLS